MISRYMMVAIAAILLVVLAGTHWKAYKLGGTAVQAKWDQDIAQRAQQALAAEQAARAREQQLVAERQKVEAQYANDKRKAAVAAAGARTELDRLRGVLAATGPGDHAAADSGAAPGADGAGRIERDLLGQCAEALSAMASTADRLAGKVVALQQYVADVCLAADDK